MLDLGKFEGPLSTLSGCSPLTSSSTTSVDAKCKVMMLPPSHGALSKYCYVVVVQCTQTMSAALTAPFFGLV